MGNQQPMSQVQSHLRNDQLLIEELDAFAHRTCRSRSAAIRFLLRLGLDEAAKLPPQPKPITKDDPRNVWGPVPDSDYVKPEKKQETKTEVDILDELF